MQAAGVTRDKVAVRLNEALDAHTVKPFIHQKSGTVVYSEPMVDHEIRLTAVELASRIRGDIQNSLRLDVPALDRLADEIGAARRRASLPQDVVVEVSDNSSKPLTP